MKSIKTIIAVLAIMLSLSAVIICGVVNAQSDPDQSIDPASGYVMNVVPDYQTCSGAPSAPAYTDEAASGMSFIYEHNGLPTTVIGADGSQTKYDVGMWDFLAGYPAGGPYGVGHSSNPNVPTTGTWTEHTTQSGTYGTQEPNFNPS